MHFDDRLIRVEFTYANTQLILDQGLDIKIAGMHFVNEMQDECALTIDNLKRETRDDLAAQLTPYEFLGKRKSIRVFAGRVSTGLSLVYYGDVIACSPSQPPNISLRVYAKTSQFFKYDMVARAENVAGNAQEIAGRIAGDNELKLRWEATNKTIRNYSYSGAAIKQIDKINDWGDYHAYVYLDTLIVKDKETALKNSNVLVHKDNGMVGVPELTEYGVRLRTLYRPDPIIGGQMTLVSESNPLLNGTYYIHQLGFQLTSRDTPFYSIIEAARQNIVAGATSTFLR